MSSLGGFLTGLALGLTMIVAIGPQSIFVLRQGLRGDRAGLVCGLCILSDAVLIGAGTVGGAGLGVAVPGLEPLARLAGAAFLAVYGLRSLAAALPAPLPIPMPADGAAVPRLDLPAPAGALSVVASCLAITWLNPHVWLDTVVVLGALGRGSGAPLSFALGAIAASALFFAGLSFGARRLRPVFNRPAAWRRLDALTGAAMVAIAAGLVAPML